MARFLFVYRGNNDAYAKLTPAQIEQSMQKWGTWIREAMQSGWMVDPGDALTPHEGRVVKSQKLVTDGPFTEAKECIGGYSIVEAASLDAAAELAKGCPGLLTGGNVEVRVLANMAAKL